MHASILGTGFYVPDTVVTNDALVARGLDSSDAWIVKHTGIHSRRIADPEQATSDLATAAAERALEHAGLTPADVELIICATSTPDHLLPSTAGLVQHRLGCKSAGAFDLNSGCSGFAYALSVGMALQERSRRHVLVIAADTYSRILDWTDRGSACFFGDGAGAVVLGLSEERWLLGTCHGSDGGRAGDIIIPAGGSRVPPTDEACRTGATRFRQRGRAVWDFVLSSFPQIVHRVLAEANLQLDDIELIVPHQANLRLLEACASALGVPMSRLFVNVDRYANTASASSAIALAEADQLGRLHRNRPMLLLGFGAGLAWSASVLRWGR